MFIPLYEPSCPFARKICENKVAIFSAESKQEIHRHRRYSFTRKYLRNRSKVGT